MARLKKGDTVAVQSGRDRGKRGKILTVLPVHDAALIERINLVKHFERRTQANQPGGIIEREAPIPLAKLSLVCPRCGKPTRVAFRLGEGTTPPPADFGPEGRLSPKGPPSAGKAGGGAKHRVCKRCQETIQ